MNPVIHHTRAMPLNFVRHPGVPGPSCVGAWSLTRPSSSLVIPASSLP